MTLGWPLEVWKAYSHRAASYQTRVLLTLVYLLIMGPTRILGGSKLLDLRPAPMTTWTTRPPQDRSLAALRRQF